tara:strand:- start:236 stop:736 length:501 start_codon:yes stop_codon:yes gene_type:complete
MPLRAMRLSIYFLTLVFLSSCTTIEVGREVVKVGTVVKDKVEETIIKKEPEIIEDKTIVEEQQIITEEKEEKKTIVKEQQKISEINFMGKQLVEVKQKLGEPNLARSDGSIYMMRYDSLSCRLFIFFKLDSNIKRVEYFEYRDSLGELLNTKQSIEECYKEYNLTN